MSPRRPIPILAALVAALAAASPAGAIVGGGPVTIENHPYQVALLDASVTTSNFDAQFCGAIIRDSTHVITAAHCVFDSLTPGERAAPSQIKVLAGTAVLSKAASPGRLAVSAISVNPAYKPATLENDSAVMTLVDPLQVDATREPVALVDDVQWAAVAPGAALVVTGWGSTSATTPAFPPDLQGVSVPLVDDGTCEDDYAKRSVVVNGQVTVCAGDTVNGGKDACQGDSGGPLVRAVGPALPGDYRLVGIVSSGIGCADKNFPGLYTEVAAPSVRSYISQAQPVAAPANTQAPSLSGAAAVGSTLECATGSWSGTPTLSVQWVRSADGIDAGLTGDGASTSYPVQAADVGGTISCIVHASNAGGDAFARTQPSDVVPRPPAGEQPAGPAPVPPSTQQDTNAPVARIRTARCVRTTCTLTVNVTDAGFSAGIAKVTGSVRSTYRRACLENGRRTTCTRHRTRAFTARRTAATRFTVKVTRLPVGTQLFTLLATDRAGHRQLLPTRKTLKTRR